MDAGSRIYPAGGELGCGSNGINEEGGRKVASLGSGAWWRLVSPEWDPGSGVKEAAGRGASTGPGTSCYIGGGKFGAVGSDGSGSHFLSDWDSLLLLPAFELESGFLAMRTQVRDTALKVAILQHYLRSSAAETLTSTIPTHRVLLVKHGVESGLDRTLQVLKAFEQKCYLPTDSWESLPKLEQKDVQ
eukprot:g36883.t1